MAAINCDPRSNLGSLADYAEGGKNFTCPDCSKTQSNPDPHAMAPMAGAGAPVATNQAVNGQMGQPNMGQMGGFPAGAGAMHGAPAQQAMQGIPAGARPSDQLFSYR